MKEKNKFLKTYTGKILTLNVFVFILMFSYNYYIEKTWDLSENTLSLFGALHPHQSPWYSLVTVMFLHGGIAHIFCNTFSLKAIGEKLEPIAPKWFLPVYIISGIASSLGVYFYGQNWTVGASGAICGIWSMLIVYEIKYRDKLKGNAIFVITAIEVGIMIYISSLPKVSAIGHFCGSVTGLVFGLIYFYVFYEEPMIENDFAFELEKQKPDVKEPIIILPGSKNWI